jgi:hypothetical protein
MQLQLDVGHRVAMCYDVIHPAAPLIDHPLTSLGPSERNPRPPHCDFFHKNFSAIVASFFI